jgi:hypothetical protein
MGSQNERSHLRTHEEGTYSTHSYAYVHENSALFPVRIETNHVFCVPQTSHMSQLLSSETHSLAHSTIINRKENAIVT